MRPVRCVLPTIILVALWPPAHAQKVIRRELIPDGVLESVLVAADRFNIEKAVTLSRKALENTTGSRFVHIQLVTEDWQAYPVPRSPVATYAGWSKMYNHLRASSWNMAEATAFGGSAVVKFRDKNGKITRRVVNGRDPLLLAVESVNFELLHFDFLRNPAGDLADVRLYVRALQRFDAELGDKLTAALSRVLPFRRASVYVRRDHWFIEEAGFPYFYPFAEGLDAPTETEYHTSATMYCSYGWRNNACKVTGKIP